MESIIAECGENERIEKFLDTLISKTGVAISKQQKYELIDEIQENLDKIIRNKVDIQEILGKVFPEELIKTYNNHYIRSYL